MRSPVRLKSLTAAMMASMVVCLPISIFMVKDIIKNALWLMEGVSQFVQFLLDLLLLMLCLVD